MYRHIMALFFVILFCLGTRLANGLEPTEVLVVANPRMAESIQIAKYYMGKRKIPLNHLLSIPLTLNETMGRREFDEALKKNIQKTLADFLPEKRIAAIVLIYGIPLKVDPPEPSWEEKELIRNYRKQQEVTNEAIKETKTEVKPNLALEKERDHLVSTINKLLKSDQRASVDSELALVKSNQYKLDGWVRNPYFLGFQELQPEVKKDDVVLVSRLDGPDVATVYRIIEDTLAAERVGLQGKAYFDARWPNTGESQESGYARYDHSLHQSAKITEKIMTTVLDQSEQLFSEECCPDAALYCGWYSLGKYINSFVWRKGAIGYHIASGECTTLRDKTNTGWCIKMLEKGVAATIGPVYEPFVQGFPLPEVFFYQLIVGGMSLGEAYLTSLPFLSWQMVLIGDPLYQPFLPFKGQRSR